MASRGQRRSARAGRRSVGPRNQLVDARLRPRLRVDVATAMTARESDGPGERRPAACPAAARSPNRAARGRGTLAGLAVDDFRRSRDEDAHRRHRALSDHDAFDHLGPRADEAMVFDDGQVVRLEEFIAVRRRPTDARSCRSVRRSRRSPRCPPWCPRPQRPRDSRRRASESRSAWRCRRPAGRRSSARLEAAARKRFSPQPLEFRGHLVHQTAAPGPPPMILSSLSRKRSTAFFSH